MNRISECIFVSIILLLIALFLMILVYPLTSDLVYVCNNKNLESKIITVENKFIVRTGILGSKDSYHFLDENGTDYGIWGDHRAARYTKLKLNQSYYVDVNIKNGNISYKEVFIKGE